MENLFSKPESNAAQTAAAIKAQLTQLASNPPDLATYLKAHAQLIDHVLHPRGISYEMRNGRQYRRVYANRLEELGLKENPAQDSAFRNAVKIAGEQGRMMMLQPMTTSVNGRDSLAKDSAVSDANIPPYNETPFVHFFSPAIADPKSGSVIQLWFDPANAETIRNRQSLIKLFSEEMVAYLRSRRSLDLGQEVTRLTTYSHLLEDLAGDIDLDSVAWSLVNFSRETVECERVSIFSVKNYPLRSDGIPSFEILATSGLRRPNPRSEQAEILKDVVRELAKLTLEPPAEPAPAVSALPEPKAEKAESPGEDSASDEGEVKRQDSKEGPNKAKSEERPPSLPTGKRPQFRLILTYRDPLKEKDRPEAINRYFALAPMNWATTLPLFDREGALCGILLFEGQDSADKAQRSFLPMRDLAYSGGRSVGTALYWKNKPSYRIAQDVERVRERMAKTPSRRMFFKVGLPILILVAVLLSPVTFKVRGTATLMPVVRETLPAVVPERLIAVYARESQMVKKGDVLAELDTRQLDLQLLKVRQDYERYMAESDMARSVGDETRMQVARLNAQQAQTEGQRIRMEIDRSRIIAPFDGVVIGPANLRQRVGEVFRIGEPVIELASVDRWEVRVDTREQDIQFLARELAAEGSVPARVKFNSDPTNEYALALTDPGQLNYGLSTARGSYVFAVVLPVEGDSGNFKVGYSGNAIFELGNRPIGYVIFRDFAHFLKLRWF